MATSSCEYKLTSLLDKADKASTARESCSHATFSSSESCFPVLRLHHVEVELPSYRKSG